MRHAAPRWIAFVPQLVVYVLRYAAFFVLLYGRPFIMPVASLMVYGSVLMAVFAYYGNYGFRDLAPYGFGVLAFVCAFLRWKYDTILFRLEPEGRSLYLPF